MMLGSSHELDWAFFQLDGTHTCQGWLLGFNSGHQFRFSSKL